MEKNTLSFESRDQMGTRGARRLRGTGVVPAVLYARGEPSVHGLLNERDFVRQAKSSRTSQVFTFKSPVTQVDGRAGIVKEVQKNFLTGKVLHVDFQLLKEGESIKVEIHLEFEGVPSGVKNEGGIFTASSHSVLLECLPKAIPDLIKVDISELNLGDSLHARDIKLPEGVKLAEDPAMVVAGVVAPKAEVEATPAVAAEGAAAVPGAEGAAAAPAAEGAEKKPEGK